MAYRLKWRNDGTYLQTMLRDEFEWKAVWTDTRSNALTGPKEVMKLIAAEWSDWRESIALIRVT